MSVGIEVMNQISKKIFLKNVKKLSNHFLMNSIKLKMTIQKLLKKLEEKVY